MAYRPSGDRLLFIMTSLLTIFGLVMVYSASSVVASTKHGMSSYYFLKQLAFAGAGYVLMVFLMNVHYQVWSKHKVVFLLALLTVLMLLSVFTQPRINGSHRWLRWGPVSFQPSEIAKLVMLIFLAAYLAKREAVINRPARGLLPCATIILLFAGLIAVEPDLGQAICIVMIAAVLLFVAGLSWKYGAAAAVMAMPAFYFFVMRVPFRWERVQAFLNPFHDPLGSGWQISQSLTAIGSGGLLGLGLGGGRQKLFYLPEAHSDFIYAVIGEEIGLAGTVLISVAFLVFFYRGLKITLRAPDRFGFYLGLGITLMIVLQAYINISMVLALIPTKGIALPFISQGGSSLLLNLLATGVLLNISHYGERDSVTEDSWPA
jgi:cell division protein FtsW